MIDRKPLVVLSGGLDSSYLLWQKLKEGNVHTCYIKATQCSVKISMEIPARQRVIKFFEELTGNQVLTDTVIDLGRDFSSEMSFRHGDRAGERGYRSNHVPSPAWGQAHMWLFGLLYVVDPEQHIEVCLGNVMGDQIALHVHDMKQAWTSLSMFAKMERTPLEFPLAYTMKDAILRRMPMDIIPHLWVCELPYPAVEGVVQPCGKCAACITMQKTIWQWEHENGRSFKAAVEEHIAQREAAALNVSCPTCGNLHQSHDSNEISELPEAIPSI